MRESETFGSEEGSGEELVQWLNEEAKKKKMKFEVCHFSVVLLNLRAMPWLADENSFLS